MRFTCSGAGAIAGGVAQRGGCCVSALRHGQQVVLPLAIARHILTNSTEADLEQERRS